MSRLALVCVSLRAGGTERIVSRIANHFVDKHSVACITLSATQPFYPLKPRILLRQPYFGRRNSLGPLWYPRMLTYLWRTITDVKPDVVLTFGEHIASVIVPVARLAGAKVVVFNRGSPLRSLAGVRGVINPMIYPLAQRAVVQTRDSIEMIRDRYLGTRFEVIPNPIEIPEFVVGLDERKARIINIGTLGGQKNQQGLLRAFAALPKRLDWQLDFVGDGPDLDALLEQAHQLGVSGQVRFFGQRSDVEALLQNARVFAFTSLTEGFPNALAEAMAAGCACISYDCPTGPSTLLEHGVSGLLVRNGDQDGFNQALSSLTQDFCLQKRLGEGARHRIQSFAYHEVLPRFEQLIHDVLSV